MSGYPANRPRRHVYSLEFTLHPTRCLQYLARVFNCETPLAMSTMRREDLSTMVHFNQEAFPDEIWLHILSHLDYSDILRVSPTCKNFKRLCEDPVLWHRYCSQAGLLSDTDPLLQASEERRSIYWKEVFKQRSRLKQNWRSGKFANFRLPHPDHPDEGHMNDVYAVQICGKVLVSASLDGTVRKWDLSTQRLIDSEMRGHNSGVLSLQCDSRPQHDIILTGSIGGELISWRFSTRSAMRVLRHAHSADILDMKLDTVRKLVVTNSADFTIKIWELEEMYNPSNLPVEEPLLPSRVISGHEVWVNGIGLCGDTLVGACVDGTVRVWNVLDGTCVKTVAGERSVACIGMIGDRILSGGADCMVTVWDGRLDRAEERFHGHKDRVTTVRCRTDKGMLDIIASASDDGSIVLRTDVSGTTRKAWSLKLPKPSVLSLDFDSRWLVYGSTAREIVGLDFANRDPAILRTYSASLLSRAHRRSVTQQAFRQTGTTSHAPIRTRYGRKSQKPRRLGFEMDGKINGGRQRPSLSCAHC